MQLDLFTPDVPADVSAHAQKWADLMGCTIYVIRWGSYWYTSNRPEFAGPGVLIEAYEPKEG
jgi:hypothetical protein